MHSELQSHIVGVKDPDMNEKFNLSEFHKTGHVKRCNEVSSCRLRSPWWRLQNTPRTSKSEMQTDVITTVGDFSSKRNVPESMIAREVEAPRKWRNKARGQLERTLVLLIRSPATMKNGMFTTLNATKKNDPNRCDPQNVIHGNMSIDFNCSIGHAIRHRWKCLNEERSREIRICTMRASRFSTWKVSVRNGMTTVPASIDQRMVSRSWFGIWHGLDPSRFTCDNAGMKILNSGFQDCQKNHEDCPAEFKRKINYFAETQQKNKRPMLTSRQITLQISCSSPSRLKDTRSDSLDVDLYDHSLKMFNLVWKKHDQPLVMIGMHISQRTCMSNKWKIQHSWRHAMTLYQQNVSHKGIEAPNDEGLWLIAFSNKNSNQVDSVKNTIKRQSSSKSSRLFKHGWRIRHILYILDVKRLVQCSPLGPTLYRK